MLDARRLAAATPATRDRFVDCVRGGSILVVILGHWLMAAVSWRGGQLQTANLLSVVPVLQPATWLLQVMPLFFAVGGFANAGSWRSTVRRGGGYADFLSHRLGRLLRPLWVFLAAWLAVAVVLETTAGPSAPVRRVTGLAVQPVWFVALYVLVVALTPITLEAHRRFGFRVLLTLVAVVAAVDVVRFTTSFDDIGYLNYAAVWLFAHQLGYLYADGRPGPASRALAVIAGAALAAIVLLTTLGPYPLSMVGLPGDRVSNMAPPSLCIVALSVWLATLALAMRRGLDRWLRAPRVWLAVVTVNRVIMTVFLWHLTALVVVATPLYVAGVPFPSVGSVGWWLLRPLWFAALLAVLAGFVGLLGRFERPAAARSSAGVGPSYHRAVLSAVAAAYVVLGLSGIALTGLWGLQQERRVELLQLSVGPLLSLVHLAVGVVLLRFAMRPQPRRNVVTGVLLFVGLAAAGVVLTGTVRDVVLVEPRNALTYLATAVLLASALPVPGRSRATPVH